MYRNELHMLENGGNDVVTFTKHNDELIDITINTISLGILQGQFVDSRFLNIPSFVKRFQAF